MTYELLASNRVVRNGNAALQRVHVAEFTKRMLNRKLRTHGIRLMRQLDEYGSFVYRLNVVHAIRKNDDNWARLRGYEIGYDAYEMYLDGPRALEALMRVNDALMPVSQAERERRKKWQRVLAKRKQRALEKKQKQEAARQKQREQNKKPAPKKKPRDRFLELFAKNNVKPQFKDSTIIWSDIKYATAWIFKVNSTIWRTASQRAESRLFDTLEHSNGRFAARTKDGFTLCFEVVGKWNGDDARLRIAFTDDNKHPLYRRARKYFRRLLVGSEQRRTRILRPRPRDILKIAA